MGRTLSILGCNPEQPPANVYDPQGDDANYGAVLKLLEPIATDPKNRHVVARASTVDAIVTALQAANATDSADPVTTLQIIAHGTAGHVQLADGNWNGSWHEYGDPQYILSRRTYHLLRKKLLPGCRVYLLGCSIGDRVPTAADDGPILLFDLSHMLLAHVLAPVGMFFAEDVDSATGMYAADPKKLSQAKNDQIEVGTAPTPPSPPSPTDDGHLSIEFTRILVTRGLDGLVTVDRPPDGDQGRAIRKLAERVLKKKTTPPILAGAEYRFLAKVDGDTWNADVLANGRVLRLSRPDAAPVYHPIGGPVALGDPRTVELLVQLSDALGALA